MGKTPDFPQTIFTELFIDGQFVTGEGEAEKVLNPATGELLAQEAGIKLTHIQTLPAAYSILMPMYGLV